MEHLVLNDKVFFPLKQVVFLKVCESDYLQADDAK